MNVLLDEDGVKIIDFGTSRIVDRNRNMTQAIGTVCYMAPGSNLGGELCFNKKEVFINDKHGYGEKADVYSFAMIMWEMTTRKEPFHEMPSFSVPVAVSEGKRPAVPKDCPEKWSKLMQVCWSQK